MRRLIVLAAAIAALGVVNYGVWEKEKLIAASRVIFLELAPVDPRSLMQGDYMALRFRIEDDASSNIRGGDAGMLIVKLDDRQVARFSRPDDGKALAGDEARVRYRTVNGRPSLAPKAFFFQEGHAERYASARYGELRLTPGGDLFLTDLRGEKLEPLKGSGE